VEAKCVGLELIRNLSLLQGHNSMPGEQSFDQFVTIGLEAVDIGRQKGDLVCV
jgi:hypothetical protein